MAKLQLITRVEGRERDITIQFADTPIDLVELVNELLGGFDLRVAQEIGGLLTLEPCEKLRDLQAAKQQAVLSISTEEHEIVLIRSKSLSHVLSGGIDLQSQKLAECGKRIAAARLTIDTVDAALPELKSAAERAVREAGSVYVEKMFAAAEVECRKVEANLWKECHRAAIAVCAAVYKREKLYAMRKGVTLVEAHGLAEEAGLLPANVEPATAS